MRKIIYGLMALACLVAVPSALASSHNGFVPPDTLAGEVVHNVNHLVERARGYTFQVDLAKHGEHPVWKALTDDVLATAAAFSAVPKVDAFIQTIQRDRAGLEGLPKEAYSNTAHPAHYGVVHPLHDKVANLAALLNHLAPQDAGVMALDRDIRFTMQVSGTGAVCGYGAYVDSRAGDGGNEQTLDQLSPLYLAAGAGVLLLVGGLIHRPHRRFWAGHWSSTA